MVEINQPKSTNQTLSLYSLKVYLLITKTYFFCCTLQLNSGCSLHFYYAISMPVNFKIVKVILKETF